MLVNLRVSPSLDSYTLSLWFQKYPYPPCVGNSEGEGVWKTKFFLEKYEPSLEFPEGRGGVQTGKPSVGCTEYGYFLKQNNKINA